MDLVMFKIFVTDLSDRIELTLNKSVDLKLGGMADSTEICAAIQWDFERLER